MNILLESRAFYPSVGGLEMMSRVLATAWQDAGHAVRVATITPLEGEDELDDLTVDRNPSSATMRRHVQWADVFVQSGVSLRSLHEPLLTGTPMVIIHHGLLSGPETPTLRSWLKRRASYLGVNVAVSRAVANTVPGPTIRIPNTFRPLFDQLDVEDEQRNGLLFVGRLVSEKRADLAIYVLSRLRKRGFDITLTICGDGPERDALEQRVEEGGVRDAVKFTGWTEPADLAEYYRTSELLLVPSSSETFGVAALEAIASGCPVVASETGGLPEAVGDCGLVVPPDDPEALTDAAERALLSDVRTTLREAMPSHVDRHRISRIASDYLHLLRRVVY
ncbi:hypothetical protein BSZ35_11080 [Salinibacter sp. 10B]|uniref:glycosyltransferase family 4 protein n=1 Tax=Salinibacter sp. 10B TaxID=1923971 RepID=UPI000CF378F9|nr:glycosyltransferase family 4 protein [Salinibacter sp. 10B]PQJ35064.1 hypothetical protein BSZ35_11080 [Salinibacter sp. 10B]